MTKSEVEEAADIFRRKLASGEITVKAKPKIPSGADYHPSPDSLPLPGEVSLNQFCREQAVKLGISPEVVRRRVRRGFMRVKRIRKVNSRVIFITP